MLKHFSLDTEVNTPDGPGIIEQIAKNADKSAVLYVVALDKPFIIADPYQGTKEYPDYLYPRSIGYQYHESKVTEK